MFFVSLAAAQTVPNPSLDADIPNAVPNTLSALEWDYDGTDVGQVGVPFDCSFVPTSDSTDGEQFARALDFFDVPSGIFRRQGLTTTVTDLTVGAPHKVRFEASLIRHYGQSSGHWSVTFAGSTLDAPTLALPAGNPDQAPWVSQEVGPFTPLSTEEVLDLRAITHADGSTNSPVLPATGCSYYSNPGATDLLLDGVEVIADSDIDGLYDDEEEALGTDPFSADSDADGLLDPEELDAGTDPLAYDTDLDGASDAVEVSNGWDPLVPDMDNDGALDGDEAFRGMDPLDPDTDDDGLQDGDELALGTDPFATDSDGDGLNDGAEVLQGFDPTDPLDPFFPDTVIVETTPATGTISTDYPPLERETDDGKNGEIISIGCDCSTDGQAAPWPGALLLAAAVARRRAATGERRAGRPVDRARGQSKLRAND